MKHFPLFSWLKNISLTTKLYFVVGIMAALIGVELFALNFTIHTLSATRALVGGEGLWSKAEKSASFNLQKYRFTHDEMDYLRYLNMLAVPLGDHKARLALSKQPIDKKGAEQGFKEGRIHPDDIDGIINLLTRFSGNRYIKSAIIYWTRGDSMITVFQQLGANLHRQILTNAPAAEIDLTYEKILSVNIDISALEDNFSFTLGEGSRWMEHLILKILLAIAVSVEFTGLFLTISVSRSIRKGVGEIINIAKKVEKGNYESRAKKFSNDEIGFLAGSFNQMVDTLQKKIEEEEKIENALLGQKELYETLLKTQSEMGEGVIITENNKITYVNEATCKIYGYTLEEILQLQSFIDMIPKQDEKETENLIQKAGQATIINKEGNTIEVEFNTRTLKINERIQAITMFRDITEKKRTEKQLQVERENAVRAELSKKVGEKFIASMSHEIRTPMNAILGFTEVVMNTPLTNEQMKYMGAIKTSGDNLLVIINDILDFSRIRAGKMPIEQKEFDLRQILSICVEMMLPRAMDKGTKISTTIDNTIPNQLIGDPTRLNQVLLNFLSNAVKFTENGEINVIVKKLSENFDNVELEFSVKDSGIGIPENKLATIFEAFTQAADETARIYGGTGLGLAIVKQLAELQGGSVSVKSKVGEGSCFSLKIKYNKVKMHIPKDFVLNGSPVIGEETNMTGLKVLLVEDNAINQLLAEKVLGDWGWEVEVAPNGLIAVEKVENNEYDVVFMDLQLPEMDGYEATSFIRNKLPVPKSFIPIIAMTAHVMQIEEQKCYAVGMDDYISKPFDKKRLYSKVVNLINDRNNNGFGK